MRAMTIWAASLPLKKKEKGSLEPGSFGFVILNQDIMKSGAGNTWNQGSGDLDGWRKGL
jgi:predicted amidohydrolase YtcJ